MGVYQNGTAVVVTETFGVETTPGDFNTFVPTDPTTVTFYLRDPDGTVETYVFGVDGEITNPSVGVYVFTPPTPDLGGQWHYRAQGTGAVVVAIEGEFSVLASSVLTPEQAEPAGGPCQIWCDPSDVIACGCDDFGSDTSVLEDACAAASELLYSISGRLFSGICGPRTVRPGCDECYCGYQVLSRGYVIGPWDWGYPLMLCDSCLLACDPSLIKLAGYPVQEITSVKIDGDTLDPTEYTLVNDRYLMRNDTGRWPVRQNLTLPDTEDGTFSITYKYGSAPPLLGRNAAGQLACQIWKQCGGVNCELPAGTTRVTRQGVTIDKMAFTAWGYRDKKWATGLPLVDMFLASVNPAGLQRRPTFWAPGKRQYAQSWGS